jgi:hypothetical protein
VVRRSLLVPVGILVLLLLATGCSAGNDASTPSPEPSETMQASDELRGLRVERIFSNAPGLGLRRTSMILTPSASILSGELEVGFPDSGRGAYLTCYRREKPTGGYSLGFESARLEGSRITVRLALEEPDQARS